MECIILAAGLGSRLSTRGCSKPLLRIAGLPLLERTLATAQAAGLDRLIVVTGHEATRVAALVAAVRERRGVDAVAVASDRWMEGNGASLLAARAHVDGDFILLMADHIVEEATIRAVLTAPAGNADLVLGADFDVSVARPDATVLRVSGDRITGIAKELAAFDAYDTGVFRAGRPLFEAAAKSCADGDASLSGAVGILAARGTACVVDVTGHFWIDVDEPADRREAHRRLYARLPKPHDGVVSRRVNRPVSTRVFTPLLLRLFPTITPNQVSVLSLVVGLGAAALFVADLWLLAGVAVHLASVLDGSDGEVARLKRLASPFGGFFDAVLDRYADAVVLAAAGWACAGGGYPTWVVVTTGALAVIGPLMQSYTSVRGVLDLGHHYQGPVIAAARGRDIRLLVLTIGAVAGQFFPDALLGALAVVGLGSNAIVARRVWLSWVVSRAPDPTESAPAKDHDRWSRRRATVSLDAEVADPTAPSQDKSPSRRSGPDHGHLR